MTPPSETPTPQGGDRGRHSLVGAVERCPFDQEDGERGARSDRVDHLGVQDLLPVRQPRLLRPGEGAHEPQARRGQVEQTVEGGEVLAQVGDLWRGELRLGQLGQHHRLAPAVDPALEERLDAVGDLELLRRVARVHRNAVDGPGRRRRVWSPDARGAGRRERGGRDHGESREQRDRGNRDAGAEDE